MDLLKKCLVEFNNQWTNKITEKEVDDDEQLRFTLLDMQNFAKKYAEAITVTHCCKSDSELLDADFISIVGKEAHFYKDGKIFKKEKLKFRD